VTTDENTRLVENLDEFWRQWDAGDPPTDEARRTRSDLFNNILRLDQRGVLTRRRYVWDVSFSTTERDPNRRDRARNSVRHMVRGDVDAAVLALLPSGQPWLEPLDSIDIRLLHFALPRIHEAERLRDDTKQRVVEAIEPVMPNQMPPFELFDDASVFTVIEHLRYPPARPLLGGVESRHRDLAAQTALKGGLLRDREAAQVLGVLEEFVRVRTPAYVVEAELRAMSKAFDGIAKFHPNELDQYLRGDNGRQTLGRFLFGVLHDRRKHDLLAAVDRESAGNQDIGTGEAKVHIAELVDDLSCSPRIQGCQPRKRPIQQLIIDISNTRSFSPESFVYHILRRIKDEFDVSATLARLGTPEAQRALLTFQDRPWGRRESRERQNETIARQHIGERRGGYWDLHCLIEIDRPEVAAATDQLAQRFLDSRLNRQAVARALSIEEHALGEPSPATASHTRGLHERMTLIKAMECDPYVRAGFALMTRSHDEVITDAVNVLKSTPYIGRAASLLRPDDMRTLVSVDQGGLQLER
jgi:hypothetical protein